MQQSVYVAWQDRRIVPGSRGEPVTPTESNDLMLELFSPSAHLERRDAGFARSVSFEARITKGRDELHEWRLYNPPPYEMRASLYEQTEADQLAFVQWVEYEQQDGPTQSPLIVYTLTVPVERGVIEFADSYYARNQRLTMRLALVEPSQVAHSQRSHLESVTDPATCRYCRFMGLSFVPVTESVPR